jgi:hypothetical protein
VLWLALLDGLALSQVAGALTSALAAPRSPSRARSVSSFFDILDCIVALDREETVSGGAVVVARARLNEGTSTAMVSLSWSGDAPCELCARLSPEVAIVFERLFRNVIAAFKGSDGVRS